MPVREGPPGAARGTGRQGESGVLCPWGVQGLLPKPLAWQSLPVRKTCPHWPRGPRRRGRAHQCPPVPTCRLPIGACPVALSPCLSNQDLTSEGRRGELPSSQTGRGHWGHGGAPR